MKSNRILAVVVTSISGDFISCFHSSTVGGVTGGIWVAGQNANSIHACYLIDGVRSKMYAIDTARIQQRDSEVANLVSDAERDGWMPFSRIPRDRTVYAPQLITRNY